MGPSNETTQLRLLASGSTFKSALKVQDAEKQRLTLVLSDLSNIAQAEYRLYSKRPAKGGVQELQATPRNTASLRYILLRIVQTSIHMDPLSVTASVTGLFLRHESHPR